MKKITNILIWVSGLLLLFALCYSVYIYIITFDLVFTARMKLHYYWPATLSIVLGIICMKCAESLED